MGEHEQKSRSNPSPSDQGSKNNTPEAVRKLGLALPVSEEDVKQAYYAKARATHPDKGGSASEFLEIKRAFDEALEFAKRNGKRLPWIGAQLPVYIDQERAIEFVQAWGGKIFVQDFDWLADTVGDDFAALGIRVTEIDLSGTEIEDKDLIELSEQVDSLPYVEKLNLAKTRVTDQGVLNLPRMGSLRELDLSDTQVSFATRRALAKHWGLDHVAGSSRVKSFMQRWLKK